MDNPYGYCRCGCGIKTTVARYADRHRNRSKGEPVNYVCGHNRRGVPGHSLYNWKGGKRKSCGYVLTKAPDHPRADLWGYMQEHVLIAEKALGKVLPINAEVHHVNGTKDSGPLVICQDRAYHMLLHQRKRAYEACGHANWRKCWICKIYDDPARLEGKLRHRYHAECSKTYQHKRYQKQKEARLKEGQEKAAARKGTPCPGRLTG